MCYTIDIKSLTPSCFQCGSNLILAQKITEHLEGSLFPQTTSTFRCSNIACQREKDKQEVYNTKLMQEKAAAKRAREL